jgi:uncharacterized coiled-coil DUF342 family protein
MTMRLTVKQLHATMQERLDMMTQQITRSDDVRYQIHYRCDSILLNLDRFKKSTAFEFRELRAEIDGLRTEVDGLRTEVDGLRVEVDGLRVDFNEFRAEVRSEINELRTEMRAGFAELRSAIMYFVEQINELKRA